MKTLIGSQVGRIMSAPDPIDPNATAAQLRDVWLQFEPKSTAGVTAEQRAQQEHVGTPVEVLKLIGKQCGKRAKIRVNDFMPLARLLWDDYGREGRIVAVHILGPMELAAPETVVPLIMDLCRTCISWEDADQLAMNALEPIVRKDPALWLDAMEPWLVDENPWVRRAGVMVIGRLPMKHADYTARCVEMSARLLHDGDTDVRRAVSFALRICARGDVAPVRDFLAANVPPADPAATWVLCDVIRSMATKLLPEFAPLHANYAQWAANETLSAKDRKSVESALKKLA